MVMVVLFNIQRYCMVKGLGGTCTVSHRMVAYTHLLVAPLFSFSNTMKFLDSACLHKILSIVMPGAPTPNTLASSEFQLTFCPSFLLSDKNYNTHIIEVVMTVWLSTLMLRL